MLTAGLHSCKRFAQEDKSVICYSCALKTIIMTTGSSPGRTRGLPHSSFPSQLLLKLLICSFRKSQTDFQVSVPFFRSPIKIQGCKEYHNAGINSWIDSSWNFACWEWTVDLQSAEAEFAVWDLPSRMNSVGKDSEEMNYTEPLQVFQPTQLIA